MMKDERMSKLQRVILSELRKIVLDGWFGVEIPYEVLYGNVRRRLRIRKKPLEVICEESGIPPELIPLRVMRMNFEEKDRFFNKYYDESLKVSFSRSLRNLRVKKLVYLIAYKGSKHKKIKYIVFTKKGWALMES